MPVMQTSDLTPRQYWEEVRANPNRAKFGFGNKAAIINIDVQRAYTDIDSFATPELWISLCRVNNHRKYSRHIVQG
jgi:hypothetical protein